MLPASAAAQGLDEVKARYTKYEYRIPMRDGKRLFTAVYVPKDANQTYPILLMRTPYNVKPYGVDQYKDNLGYDYELPSGYDGAWVNNRGEVLVSNEAGFDPGVTFKEDWHPLVRQ